MRGVLAALALAACADSDAAPGAGAVTSRCELPEPTVLRREGGAVLQVYVLVADPIWESGTLPEAPGYLAYRDTMRAAGADRARPLSDPPRPASEAEEKMWAGEAANVDLMFSDAGEVRRIRCLEAALFALQDARHSQLTRPTEFIAHLLRRGDSLRVYFGAGDAMFPPRAVYGLAEVTADVAAGWTYGVVLHNHTLLGWNGRLALGVPAPSTSDVQLFRGLVEELGLREVWVTNGMYTGVVRAGELGRFHSRE